MRILFTGASSCTGLWFVKALAARGHQIVMTFRRERDAYQGVRHLRVEQLCSHGSPVFDCRFGSRRFMELIGQEADWDLLCHHAAEVSDYKSPDFDISAAVRNNTLNVHGVLPALMAKRCRRIVLTGSVFEPNEGAGTGGLPAITAYGLSKAITAQIFTYYAQQHGASLGKFVIANCFGPYEQPRFTSYLVRSWFEGKTATVDMPLYVRDNIHVSLLAEVYADFAASLPAQAGLAKLNPSGEVESAGALASRFAQHLGPRLRLRCPIELRSQTEFDEPRVRINTDPVDADRLGWDEQRAWDELAEYYRQTYAPQVARSK